LLFVMGELHLNVLDFSTLLSIFSCQAPASLVQQAAEEDAIVASERVYDGQVREGSSLAVSGSAQLVAAWSTAAGVPCS
jgi:hypothetical protein